MDTTNTQYCRAAQDASARLFAFSIFVCGAALKNNAKPCKERNSMKSIDEECAQKILDVIPIVMRAIVRQIQARDLALTLEELVLCVRNSFNYCSKRAILGA